MQQQRLSVSTRQRLGTGASRADRRAGQIPGIIYGGGKPPVAITAPPNALWKLIDTGRLNALVLALEIDGRAKEMVVTRGVSFHRVTDALEHIDFMRVQRTSRIQVATPLNFINQHICPGIKLGGVLNIVRHTVELKCAVSDIPDEIVVDLARYRIGQTIHISMVKLPPGATPVITDRDFTVATITAPRGLQLTDEGAETEDSGTEEA